MKNHHRNLLSALAVLTLVLGACSAEASAGNEPNPGASGEGPPATLTADTRRQITAALSAYERVRAALVADRGDVASAAREIASQAHGARGAAPSALRAHLDGIATEANELAASPATDLPRLRREFGDVSRHVVALLTAEASLARGLHVFECPMAEGYGRWVQPSADISNPYMGTRMPACGTETSF
ncbi:MAG: DUF3347 domain-containing protein [Sandaracinus sp.]|nr:DUF3347 domain-containing protein [Sandaracinus sp.]